MTALAADSLRTRRGAQTAGSPYSAKIEANTKIYQGAGTVKNAAGRAVPAGTATGVTLGVARQQYDNTGGAAGAMDVECDAGEHFFASGTAGDAITAANIGADCYWIDDDTVGLTNGGGARSRAGKITDFDPSEPKPVAVLLGPAF